MRSCAELRRICQRPSASQGCDQIATVRLMTLHEEAPKTRPAVLLPDTRHEHSQVPPMVSRPWRSSCPSTTES